MNKQPVVSVVVPTYNRKELLEGCIDSLLKQSYPKYEIIVVDDGSTDGTKKLLEKYSKKNPNLKFFTQENKGSYAARNLGIKNSKGEIICFTDDDCIADKDWIKNLIEGYTDDSVGGVGGKIASYSPQTLLERYSGVIDLLNQEEYTKVFFMTANASYRRSVLKRVKGFDIYFRNGGDVDIGIRVILSGYDLAYNPRAIVYHKHRATLKGLIKQKYFHGRGYSCLHKKYTKNFNPKKQILFLSSKLLQGIVLYPLMILKSFFVQDKIFYLTKRLLDILLLLSFSIGVVDESLFGRKYLGQTIDQKIKFIEKANITGGWGL